MQKTEINGWHIRYVVEQIYSLIDSNREIHLC